MTNFYVEVITHAGQRGHIAGKLKNKQKLIDFLYIFKQKLHCADTEWLGHATTFPANTA
jgi:hypothetical protein